MALAPLETLFFDVMTAITGISIVLFFVKQPGGSNAGKEKAIQGATE
ncbi:MAG: hypothetical protein LBG43_07760 [Treponema sp.]|jgi:hypothetical protein|nr:hypothetical protein [Treponema sp.]